MFNFFYELKNKYKEIQNIINAYQIVTINNNLMYIEGNTNLLSLTSESITFKVNDGVVVVLGKDLSIKDITKNTLTIIGKIKSWEKI